jgi:hypothetical protein
MVRGRRQKALPWVANFATNLCRENGGMFRAFLGAKIPWILFLTARLSDNRGHPFWQKDFFGQKTGRLMKKAASDVDMLSGALSALRIPSRCRLGLWKAKRQTFHGETANLFGKAQRVAREVCGCTRGHL